MYRVATTAGVPLVADQKRRCPATHGWANNDSRCGYIGWSDVDMMLRLLADVVCARINPKFDTYFNDQTTVCTDC